MLDYYTEPTIVAQLPSFVQNILKSKDIERHAMIKKYRKKDIVYKEGDIGSKIYIVLKGVVMTYRTASNGQQRVLQYFIANNVYGNVTMVDDLVYTLSAEVIEPTINLEIDKTYFKHLVQQHPELLWFLYEDLAKKLKTATQVIEDTYLTAEQRIAKSIVHLSRQFGYKGPNGIELRINVTQEDLARLSGTTRVTVAKVLSLLIKENIITTRPKPWVIHHVDKIITSYLLEN